MRQELEEWKNTMSEGKRNLQRRNDERMPKGSPFDE